MTMTPEDATRFAANLDRLVGAVEEVLLGKNRVIRLAFTALLSEGHLLLEDVPGVGKTTLAEAIARSFGLDWVRIQFTSDLMPADLLGGQIYKPQTGEFELRKGPLFQQLVLADELNRAPPRTQSALLEAMAGGQVSLDGVTWPLPAPFVVVATQNPADLAGTYPLPDSQLDRFLMRLSLGHPSAEIEARLLQARSLSEPVRTLPQASSPEELLALQRLAASVSVSDEVAAYAVRLGEATRTHPDIERGASTRALLSVMDAARAHALWDTRDFVTPGDVRAVLVTSLAHRLLLRSAVGGTFSRDEAAHLVSEVIGLVPEPR